MAKIKPKTTTTEDSKPQEPAKKKKTVITYAEAGRQIGKHRDTIRRWANDGLIPIVRHPNNFPGIYQEDFDDLYGAAILLNQSDDVVS